MYSANKRLNLFTSYLLSSSFMILSPILRHTVFVSKFYHFSPSLSPTSFDRSVNTLTLYSIFPSFTTKLLSYSFTYSFSLQFGKHPCPQILHSTLPVLLSIIPNEDKHFSQILSYLFLLTSLHTHTWTWTGICYKFKSSHKPINILVLQTTLLAFLFTSSDIFLL